MYYRWTCIWVDTCIWWTHVLQVDMYMGGHMYMVDTRTTGGHTYKGRDSNLVTTMYIL